MKSIKFSQSGFSAILIVLAIAVVGIAGLVAWKVVGNSDKPTSSQVTTSDLSALTPQDAVTLTAARELKKVDFDLDGTVNSADTDDDGDDINDDEDTDDDNDGEEDNEDTDDDNDGEEDGSDEN